MKILVVDDSPTMRRIVCNALQEIGYEDFFEAENGADALNKIEHNSIDFIITDWNMPSMNGLELTRAIRGHNKHRTMPILMITTRGMKEDVLAAMHARVNNYIVKPFTAGILQEKIDLILNLS